MDSNNPFSPEDYGMQYCSLCYGMDSEDEPPCIACGGFGLVMKEQPFFKRQGNRGPS
jgi:hypothetical protein